MCTSQPEHLREWRVGRLEIEMAFDGSPTKRWCIGHNMHVHASTSMWLAFIFYDTIYVSVSFEKMNLPDARRERGIKLGSPPTRTKQL